MKTLRRILFYVALALAVMAIALVSAVFLFKDRIIQEFIREANKQLSTPVKVGQIDVSMMEDFPQLSIVLHNVYVEDSHEGQYPLLTAKLVSFQLHPIEVWKGNYSIRGLKIEDSETHLKINEKGENNYQVVKEKSNTQGKSVAFELKNVALTRTIVHYTDVKSNVNLIFQSNGLKTSIQTIQDVFNIHADGDITTEKITIRGSNYLSGKTFRIISSLVYHDNTKELIINPSTLAIRNSSFSIAGNYRWKEKDQIDLKTAGKDTDIQTILSLLPEHISKNFEKYRSKGDVYFNSHLKGEISKKKSPGFTVEFGFKNATIYHPDYRSKITEARLTGSFATPDVSDERLAALVLKNIQGKLNEELFTANFIIQNFKNPEVICDFKGKVDASSLLGFYPIENISSVSGSLLADISFDGRIELLKKKATAQRVSTQGTIDLQNISLVYGKNKIPLQNLNGSLQFSNNDLALSNVNGKLGNSDFLLNGFFKNIITFLLFENQPIGIETDLKSKFLDLDQLFAIGFGEPSQGKDQQYVFSISRNIYLNFNCDVQALRYKRFHGRFLKGDLLVKNQVAVSRNLSVETMGGNLSLSGIVDATNNKAIDVVCTAKLNHIYVDSAFYVFQNFNQDFIQDKHLKGQATADINLELALNQNLKLFPETLIADIGAVIKNGELNNFEPMKKLNKFLDDEGLSKLRFSDLKNDIHIEKKTIYIPQMSVRSNVTDIKISGTHTFDQQIDYRLITPLRGKKQNPEAAQAIESDNTGQSKLYLKIVGSTDNYRVLYDTEAVKKKIISDLKKEVQELKDAFKNKGTQKKKELELEKDDYFDWDDNR